MLYKAILKFSEETNLSYEWFFKVMEMGIFRKTVNIAHLCQVYNSAIQRLKETLAGLEPMAVGLETSNICLLKAVSHLSVLCLLSLGVKGQGIICCTVPWLSFWKHLKVLTGLPLFSPNPTLWRTLLCRHLNKTHVMRPEKLPWNLACFRKSAGFANVFYHHIIIEILE